MIEALYFDTFNGRDYFRDKHGNVYTKVSDRVSFCSVLKRGQMTLDKSEPYYEVNDVILIKEGNKI